MNGKVKLIGLSTLVILVAGLLSGAVVTWLDESPNPGIVEAAAPELPEAATGKEMQILSTAELMKLMMDPVYEQIKDAIETPPEKRKQWRALYIATFPLMEQYNLMYSRMDEPDYQATPEWKQEVDKSMTIALKFAKSVRGRAEFDVLKADYLAMVASCNDCHNTFEPGEIDKIEPPESWLDPNAPRGKEGPPL